MPPSTSLFSISHPATTISHSLCCPFISPSYNTLITASAHSISLYHINNDEDFLKEEVHPVEAPNQTLSLNSTQNDKNASALEKVQSEMKQEEDDETDKKSSALVFEYSSKNKEDSTKNSAPLVSMPVSSDTKDHLVHVATIPIHGTISSMCSFRIAPSKRHVLAISFLEDAKISVVEYDDAKNSLKTVSLHYLEDDVLKDGKSQMHQRVEAPLKADPNSRCLSYILFDSKLVILPVREEAELEDLTNNMGSTRHDESTLPPPVQRHIIIDVAQRLGIRNVKDYCFLYGYSEPTLLILHENTQTWGARLRERANTVSCTAVSLGIERNQYPIIWTVRSLAHDAYQLIPLKENIGGGALIVGHNAVVHVNQRAQYGLSTNDFAHMEECHPDQLAVHLEKQEDLAIMLEMVSYSFIATNVIAMSLRGGELYLLHVFGNSGSVQKVVLRKAKNTVVAATMSTVNGRYLFLGSRLGNSLLSEYKEKNKRKLENGEEPEKKKRRTEKSNDNEKKEDANLASNDDFLKMLEIDAQQEVSTSSKGAFSEDTESMNRVREFTFRVKDSFINIGPITSMAVGTISTRANTMELKSRTDPRVELATCSGHAKTGSICLLQRNIRPLYLSNMKLTPQISAWHTCDALYFINHSNPKIGKILIASMGPRSIIMNTASAGGNSEDIFARIQRTRMNIEEPTLAAGSLTDDRSISVQVCPSKITVLKDAKIMYTKPFDIPVHSAHVLAPYVLLHFEDGTIKLFTASQKRRLTTRSIHLTMAKKTSTYDARDMPPEVITATSLFRNQCRNRSLFAIRDPDTGKLISPEYLCFVCWANGAMEIYTVPDFKCVFSFMQLSELYGIMFDQNPTAEERDDLARKRKLTSVYVQEILMHSISSDSENPYLFVRLSDNSLHIYQTFSFNSKRASTSTVLTSDILQQQNENRLSHLRFTKVEHEYMGDLLSKKNRSSLRLDLLNRNRHHSVFDKRHDTGLKKIVPFKNVGMGYRGVFVTGKTALWILADVHNEMRIHPMTIDGAVSAFVATTKGKFMYATTNPTNLPVQQQIKQPSSGSKNLNGGRQPFIAADAGSFLRVATFHDDLLYDTHWPTRVIPLKRTPHQIVFEKETSTYAVAVSKPIAFENVDKALEGRFPKPQSLKFQVELFSQKWQQMGTLDFNDFEQVLSMRIVSLMDRGEDPYNPKRNHEKSVVTLLAIGTGVDGSEDDTCTGRVLLYDYKGSIEADEHFKFEKVGSLVLKGPVSAIESMDGYLCISLGDKINTYYYDWDNKSIVQCSFFDSQHFTTSMKSIKNYLLYGDMYNSLNLLRWKENGHQLTLLGKDPHLLFTYDVEFMYSENELVLFVSDEEQNIQLFRFAPEEASTHDGRWLLPVADFHVGSHINTTVRLPARHTHPSERFSGQTSTGLIVFATLEGEIGSLVPMESTSFRALSLLQSKFYTQVPHACGLHPKAFRLFQPNPLNCVHIHQKNVLDGELLKQYMHCDQKLQQLIAKQLGYKPRDFSKALLGALNKTMYF